MAGPVHPDEYDGEHLSSDAKLREEGWAAGLDVWGVLDKTHSDALADGTVANAQLWSLQQAVRAQTLAEVWQHVVWQRGPGVSPDLAILAVAEKLGVAQAMADYLPEES